MSPPTISKHPESVNISVYESASFNCTARGYGLITIVWKRHGFSLPSTATVTEIKSLNTMTSILTITGGIGYYSGQYYCVAKTKAEEISSHIAILQVQGVVYFNIKLHIHN